MDKLCFSIDEERYDDRHGHVLSLVGWYMHPDKKECGFQLIGDGYEVIDIPEVERYDRPDVAQSLEVETEGFLPGFTVTIPEVLKLRQKYDILELLLLDGEEKTVIWEHTGDELDELVKDKLVEFHIDRVEVLYGLMLEIQGWTTDQRGEVEVTVHKENAVNRVNLHFLYPINERCKVCHRKFNRGFRGGSGGQFAWAILGWCPGQKVFDRNFLKLTRRRIPHLL